MQVFNLQDAFNQPDEVKSLTLQHQPIAGLFDNIHLLVKLEKLTVQNAQLSKLPTQINWPSTITQLDFAHNQFKNLKVNLPPHLERLILNQNQIEQFPAALEKANKLVTLDLSHNQLKHIPDTIKSCTQLSTLLLSHNRLAELSRGINKLHQLKKLDLSYNKLKGLDLSLGKLGKLEILNLSNNSLSHLSAGLMYATQVTQLNISNNQLKKLPRNFGMLTQLRLLDLSNNQLKALPSSFSKLSWLSQLNLSHNRLTKFPNAILSSTKLYELNLSHNKILQVPSTIDKLEKLSKLDLSFNKLNYWPGRLNELTQLNTLNLSGIHCTAIPKDIKMLTNLKTLRLNQISFALSLRPLLQLPQLKTIESDTLSSKGIFYLLSLLHFKKQFDLETKVIQSLWNLFEQNKRRSAMLTILRLLPLAPPYVQFILREQILKLDEQPIREFYVLGRLNIHPTTLNPRLGAFNIKRVEKLTKSLTHIVIGEPPYSLNANRYPNISFISERQLLIYLNRLEKDDNEISTNAEILTSMIQNGSAPALRLLANLLWGTGVTNEIWDTLFTYYKMEQEDSEIKALLEKLLYAHASEENRLRLITQTTAGETQ